ncbi:hypothetical protein ACFGVR_22355 [Mucilaginibacter sp. AW1-3]
MRTIKLLLLIGVCLVANNCAAQRLKPGAIEKDLWNFFTKRIYWKTRKGDTTISALDSLEKADKFFANKLKWYTTQYPATITQAFFTLRETNLTILTSNDRRFRIYSWDNEMGDCDNLMQFKVDAKTRSVLKIDTIRKGDEKSQPLYRYLYTFNINGKAYYIATYEFNWSYQAMSRGVRIFEVRDGELRDAKIIRTTTGMHSRIDYDFNTFSYTDGAFPEIIFDAKSNTLSIPVVSKKEVFIDSFIRYKFTGKYFEKVK